MAIMLTLVSAAAAPGDSPVLTLTQSIDAALADGYDNRILQANLDVSRAQFAQTVSKNSFSLGSSAGIGYNAPFGSAALQSSKGSFLAASTAAPQGAQVGLALSGPLTAVSLTAVPWSPPVGSSGDTTSLVSVSATQVLWNGYPGGPLQAGVDKGALALQGTELAAAASRRGLVFRVKQAYFTMFAAQEGVAVARQIQDKQDALLAQITTVYKLKQASDVDLKTAQINARSAQIDLQSAEHALRQARLQLAILMGRSADDQFSVTAPEIPAVPAATLEEAIAQALGQRVDLKQIELSRKSVAIDISLARGQATPALSVVGGIGQALDWNQQSAWYAGAGVKLSLPILDAGASQSLVTAGQKQDEAYSLQERQLQRTISALIQNDWENVQIANERVELARLAAENDDMLVEVYRIQNLNGAASAQDLLSASVTAAGARTAYVQAQNNAALAVLQLQSDSGL
jgi:outer membrane protein TolC